MDVHPRTARASSRLRARRSKWSLLPAAPGVFAVSRSASSTAPGPQSSSAACLAKGSDVCAFTSKRALADGEMDAKSRREVIVCMVAATERYPQGP